MPHHLAKTPPVGVIRVVGLIRSALRKLNRSLLPGNIALLEVVSGSWVTQAIYVAARLGIADQLADGPRSADDVARRVGADPDGLFRLMRALAANSVLKHRRDGRFALTPLGQALRTDSPGSLRNMALMIGDPAHWQHWGNLLHSVQTGEPAVVNLRGMPFFSYLDTNPAFAEVFNNAMTDMSGMANDAVLSAYDFTPFRLIVDVGGGHGSLLSAILRGAPDASGVLYDLPGVVDGADATLQGTGVASRCARVGGSFFDKVPEGGDAYVLRQIIHDWDDDDAVRILRNVRAAIEPDGKVLILDMVLPERASSHFGMMLDLEMLVAAGGRERTRAQFSDILTQAGFRLSRVVGTAGPISVVEAVPV